MSLNQPLTKLYSLNMIMSKVFRLQDVVSGSYSGTPTTIAACIGQKHQNYQNTLSALMGVLFRLFLVQEGVSISQSGSLTTNLAYTSQKLSKLPKNLFFCIDREPGDC